MADVSAALPSESALRKERQARWDSDVSEGSSREDKVCVCVCACVYASHEPRDGYVMLSRRSQTSVAPSLRLALFCYRGAGLCFWRCSYVG